MALVLFAAVVVTAVTYFAWGRRRLVAARKRLPPDDPVFYEGVVRAKVRRDYTQAFVYAKGGMYVVVTANAIQLEFPGPGELLGMDLLIATQGSRLRRARLGWVGTPLDRREYVVVAGEELKGEVELALAPKDRDLDRLERALLEAGVERD